jgi:hypothetical protein
MCCRTLRRRMKLFGTVGANRECRHLSRAGTILIVYLSPVIAWRMLDLPVS